MNVLAMLQNIDGAATARTVATDGLTPGSARLLPKAFPSAEIVDGEDMLRRARRIKSARGGRRDPRVGSDRRDAPSPPPMRHSCRASPNGSSPPCSWRRWPRRASPRRRRRTSPGSRRREHPVAPFEPRHARGGRRPRRLRRRRHQRRLRRRARADELGGWRGSRGPSVAAALGRAVGAPPRCVPARRSHHRSPRRVRRRRRARHRRCRWPAASGSATTSRS